MLFNSAQFLVFLPLAAFGYYLIPHKYRYLWLLVCSYFFYMCWNPVYAILIFASTVITWLCGFFLEKINDTVMYGDRQKRYCKCLVAVCILLNLAILGYFKYVNFFIESLNHIFEYVHMTYQIPTVDLLLPVGISFYTFQALGYIVDVYRGDICAEKNFFRYALFVSFFPQLVAGPIERSKNLLRQLNETHKFSGEQIRSGFMLMLWGYFLKMVVADRIAIFVDAVYENYESYRGWYLIVASVLFAFQIYCDFAGYSTIAMGAAEIMGFKLTDNFNAPYFSQSVSEFWRRWHISLFSWFRDYLYIPLGGNKKGTVRKYLNLMIVFLLSGLWHGADWSFVVWGGLNGVYQIIGSLLKPMREKAVEVLHLNRGAFSHKLYKCAVTFCLIDFSWIFFRSNSLIEALKIIKRIITVRNSWVLFDDSLFQLGLNWKNFMIMLLSIVVLIWADYMKNKGIIIRQAVCRQEWWFRGAVLIIGILTILIFGIWGSGYNAASFIYFQF